MNYIWELAIQAQKRQMSLKDIQFYEGKPFSGYMELSFECMNETNIPYKVEINPYYRYHDIFNYLLDPSLEENPELIQVIFDLGIHHLIDIDVLMGMGRKEYYIAFLLCDIQVGHFGEEIQKSLNILSIEEQKIIMNHLLKLYDTGEMIYLLKETVRHIFKGSYIFCNTEEKNEITFYLRTVQTEEKEKKLEIIKSLFLPIQYEVITCWEHIFGLIGVDDFMKIDQIMNY